MKKLTAFGLLAGSSQAAQMSFLQDEDVNQELISTKNYPCIFKLESAFYDLTPLKIGNDGPYDATYALDTDISYQFQFCQVLSDVKDASCPGDYYASQKDEDS